MAYRLYIELSNATCNYTYDDTFESGEEIRIEITANDGYYFSAAPTIHYTNDIGDSLEYMFHSDDEGEYKTHFYYDIAVDTWISIYGDAQVIPEVDRYGIITMYNPTPQELKKIGEVRYTRTDTGGVNRIDLGEYISSLIKVYVKIPKGNKANVLLGGYNTKVEANVITNDIVETDCGTVEVIGRYNNSMDYENTTVEIYLPLIGFQSLDTDKVMNETLSLIYKTNVINGDTIACIYNTTGTLLYTFNCKASFEIPYRMNSEIETKGNVDVNSNYLFGFTPFVNVRYNKAYHSATMASDNRETTLEYVQGYVKCSEVFNTINATAAEKEEIDNLLKSGVIIS